MKSIFILFCLAATLFSFAQEKPPSITEVKKFIRKSIAAKATAKNNYSCEYGECGVWSTNNDSGRFKKSDTIRFYDNSGFYNQRGICNYTRWEFSKTYHLMETGYISCHEPPMITMEVSLLSKKPPKTPNRFTLARINSRTVLETWRNKKHITSYWVIGLEKIPIAGGDSCTQITLLRKK
jgi:hypothetical protein